MCTRAEAVAYYVQTSYILLHNKLRFLGLVTLWQVRDGFLYDVIMSIALNCCSAPVMALPCNIDLIHRTILFMSVVLATMTQQEALAVTKAGRETIATKVLTLTLYFIIIIIIILIV